jgi:hypothetical protein
VTSLNQSLRDSLLESCEAVEGSSLRPIVLGEDGIDQEQRCTHQTKARSVASTRSLGENSSRYSNRTTQSAPVPRLPKSSSVKSSSSTPDRIEEARLAAQDRTPLTEMPATGTTRDRIEATRESVPIPNSFVTASVSSISSRRVYPKTTPGRRSLDALSNSSRPHSHSVRHDQPSSDSLALGSGKSSSIDPSSRSRTSNTTQSRTSSDYGRSALYGDEELETALPTLDLRTVRLLNSKEFSNIIARHKKRERFHESQDENRSPPEDKAISFFARIRPMSMSELERGEFDVVGVESKDVVVYQTELKSDLKTKLVTPVSFGFDSVFTDNCSSDEFFLRVGRPLVLTAKSGGMAAAVILGQSGSGKGLTMAVIEERVVCDVFDPIESKDGLRISRPPIVSIQLVECAGNECIDLLGASRTAVQVATKEGGYFWIKGAESKTVSCATDLLNIVSDAKHRRADELRKKGKLSQPHVICQILIRQEGRRGSLSLVECGSMVENVDIGNECREESEQSFKALVQCIRARVSEGQRHDSYFSSSLAKIMREFIERDGSRISIVATVSPKANDTEGTIETLRNMSYMMGVGANKTPASKPRQGDLVLPRQWGHEDLVDWLIKKQLMGNPFPTNINGRMAMRLTKQQIKSTFYDPLDDAKAERLYVGLRAENDRIARIRVKRRIALEKQTAEL